LEPNIGFHDSRRLFMFIIDTYLDLVKLRVVVLYILYITSSPV